MTVTPLFDVLTEDVLQQAVSKMPHGRAIELSEVANWFGLLISFAGDIPS
jgi:hypothetical protein